MMSYIYLWSNEERKSWEINDLCVERVCGMSVRVMLNMVFNMDTITFRNVATLCITVFGYHNLHQSRPRRRDCCYSISILYNIENS